MIETVIFDLDDTLYLESDFVASGYRAVAHGAGMKFAGLLSPHGNGMGPDPPDDGEYFIRTLYELPSLLGQAN